MEQFIEDSWKSLREITTALLQHIDSWAEDIFGDHDAMKAVHL